MAELHEYEVPHRDHTVTVQLSEADAKALYPGATRVGDVAPGEPQPVTRPPWAVETDETGAVKDAEPDHLVTSEKAGSARNKARTTK